MKNIYQGIRKKENSTDCPILDKLGIYAGNAKVGIGTCLHCSVPECYLDKEEKDVET